VDVKKPQKGRRYGVCPFAAGNRRVFAGYPEHQQQRKMTSRKETILGRRQTLSGIVDGFPVW
jgi:hypothetical protein